MLMKYKRWFLTMFLFSILLISAYLIPTLGYIVLSLGLIYILIYHKELLRFIRLLLNRKKKKVKCPKCHTGLYVQTSNTDDVHYCFKCLYLFKLFSEQDSKTYTLEQAWNTFLLANLGVMIQVIRHSHNNQRAIDREEEVFLSHYINYLKDVGLKSSYVNKRFKELQNENRNLSELLEKVYFYSHEFADQRFYFYEQLLELATIKSSITPAQRVILIEAGTYYGISDDQVKVLFEQYNKKHSCLDIGRDVLVVLDYLIDDNDKDLVEKKLLAGRFYTSLMSEITSEKQVTELIEAAFDAYDQVKNDNSYVDNAIEHLSVLSNYNISEQFFKVCKRLVSTDENELNHQRLINKLAQTLEVESCN